MIALPDTILRYTLMPVLASGSDPSQSKQFSLDIYEKTSTGEQRRAFNIDLSRAGPRACLPERRDKVAKMLVGTIVGLGPDISLHDTWQLSHQHIRGVSSSGETIDAAPWLNHRNVVHDILDGARRIFGVNGPVRPIVPVMPREKYVSMVKEDANGSFEYLHECVGKKLKEAQRLLAYTQAQSGSAWPLRVRKAQQLVNGFLELQKGIEAGMTENELVDAWARYDALDKRMGERSSRWNAF